MSDLDGELHKVIAVLMLRYGQRTVRFTADDFMRLQKLPAHRVVFIQHPDALEVSIVEPDKLERRVKRRWWQRQGRA